MYPRAVYYRHGFAKKGVLMCDDCHKLERQHFGFRLVAVTTEDRAYEAICLTIKEQSSSFLLYNNNLSLDKEGISKIGTRVNFQYTPPESYCR
jgi:hypothetical protein